MYALTPVKTRRHGVYFYHHSDYLTQRVVHFVREGLSLDETVIVVATKEHRRAVRKALALKGSAHESAYLDVDAEEYIAEFCADGILNKNHFLTTVMPFLGQAHDLGRPIRLYGEGVAVLWNRGFRQAAIELEEWWNELLDQYRFSTILCGYNTEAHKVDELLEILDFHTHICLGDVRLNGCGRVNA